MQVLIKEKEYEYQSDYNKGWIFSSGDDFKFPVLIGKYPCFIKRFERQGPARITGWGLLQRLKASYEPGLPRIHDIVPVREHNKDIHYVFYECLEGDTMDNLIRSGDIPDPARLTEDLFRGLGSVHRHGYWVADFCEKNIFCRKDKRYFQVDLDSTQPLSAVPDNGMYANKEYWASAFAFLIDRAGCTRFKPSDISGALLNYIQAMLLVLRVRLCLTGKQKDYKSTELYESLPGLLDKAAPELKTIFSGMLKRDQQAPDAAEIGQLKTILLQKIVRGNPDFSDSEKIQPVVDVVNGANEGNGSKDWHGEKENGKKGKDRHGGSSWKGRRWKVLVTVLILLLLLAIGAIFLKIKRDNAIAGRGRDTTNRVIVTPVIDSGKKTIPPPVLNLDSIRQQAIHDSLVKLAADRAAARKRRREQEDSARMAHNTIAQGGGNGNTVVPVIDNKDQPPVKERPMDKKERTLIDSLVFFSQKYQDGGIFGLGHHRRIIMENKSYSLMEKVTVEIINPDMGKNEIMTLSQVRPRTQVILLDKLPKDSKIRAVAKTVHLPQPVE